MALTVAGRTVRPLTVDEVMAMLEAGIIPGDNRLELLDGVLTEKPVKSAAHEEVKRRLLLWLDPTGNAEHLDVLVEAGLVVPDRTGLPEPDLMVLPATRDRLALPTQALLAIEVAVTTQATDLGRKAELYAETGVPEYWVVDVPARQLVRCTRPTGGRYARREELAPPALPRPVALGVGPLDLEALLAGLG
jgi:Uma2 family endonuclease